MLSFRPLWKFTAAMLSLFLGCIALGMWQLERLQWKLDLIAQVNRNLHLPAIPIDQALAAGVRNVQYRHVLLRGRFDNAKEAYVFGTGDQGAIVYHVITPFFLNDAGALLVDRGYVPQLLREPTTRRAGELEGLQKLTGVLRIPDPSGLFTPAPNLGKRVWYARDVQGIARADHVQLGAPVIIEADATPNPGGWPKGGQTVASFRNDHLQYAITWFLLTAVVLGGWIVFHISRGRIVWRSRE